MFQKVYTVKNSDPFKLIERAEVVSFDVFDTAIVRPFLHHREMYYVLEKKLGYVKFHDVRINAEKTARKNLIPKVKEEVNLLDVYDYINVDKNKAINEELTFDVTICRRREFVFELYQHAVALRKRVVFTSDITYSKRVMQEILHQNGFDCYEELYISSESGLSKYCGGLFGKVLSEMKVSGRRVLHIGDGHLADIKMARTFGIKTFHISRPYHDVEKAIGGLFNLRSDALSSALFGVAGNVVFDDPNNEVLERQRAVLSALFLLGKLVEKTQEKDFNVFLVENANNGALFKEFNRLHKKVCHKIVPVLEINLNDLCLASIMNFEDLQVLKGIIGKERFIKFLADVCKVENESDLERVWNQVEILALKSRRNVRKLLDGVPNFHVYSFVEERWVLALIEKVMNAKCGNFYFIDSILQNVILASLKKKIIGKSELEGVFLEFYNVLNSKSVELIRKKIDYFSNVLGKFWHLL